MFLNGVLNYMSRDSHFYSEINYTNSFLQHTSKLIVHIITGVG